MAPTPPEELRPSDDLCSPKLLHSPEGIHPSEGIRSSDLPPTPVEDLNSPEALHSSEGSRPLNITFTPVNDHRSSEDRAPEGIHRSDTMPPTPSDGIHPPNTMPPTPTDAIHPSNTMASAPTAGTHPSNTMAPTPSETSMPLTPSVASEGPRPSENWPWHWYDLNGNLACLAPGCMHRFDDETIQTREKHWDDQDESSPLWASHRILLAMNRQFECVICDYVNPTCLKSLMVHEQVVHNTMYMSCIQGWLNVLRFGVQREGVSLCERAIFRRLTENVYASPYRDLILARAEVYQWQHGPPTHDHVARVISRTNTCRGYPAHATILTADFLCHLSPKWNSPPEYVNAHRDLRLAYAKGAL